MESSDNSTKGCIVSNEHGPPYATGVSLDPPDSSMQTTSRSLQLFLQGSLGDRPTDRPTDHGDNKRSGAYSGEAKFCYCLRLQQVFIGAVDSTDRINFSNQQLYSAVKLDRLQCIWRHYNIASKRESVSHRRIYATGDTTVYCYLLMHKLFSSCSRRYLVSRACDWLMPALSAVLLTFNFQFSLLFFHDGSQAAAASYVVYPMSDVGRFRKLTMFVLFYLCLF